VSDLTLPPAKFSYSNNANNGHNVEDRELEQAMDRGSALGFFLKHLRQDDSLKERGGGEVELVVHTIVHGGFFQDVVVLSQETIQEIERLTGLAPLY
jgi:acetate kinase